MTDRPPVVPAAMFTPAPCRAQGCAHFRAGACEVLGAGEVLPDEQGRCSSFVAASAIPARPPAPAAPLPMARPAAPPPLFPPAGGPPLMPMPPAGGGGALPPNTLPVPPRMPWKHRGG